MPTSWAVHVMGEADKDDKRPSAGDPLPTRAASWSEVGSTEPDRFPIVDNSHLVEATTIGLAVLERKANRKSVRGPGLPPAEKPARY